MVGLGCGARSYTGQVHYSSEYAVGSREVRSIIASYSARTSESFGEVGYGFRLDGEERRRRYMLLSLLAEGVDFATYREQFCTDVLEDFPELLELEVHGLARRDETALRLTAAGVERSDLIGPWLHSTGVRELSQEYAWR